MENGVIEVVISGLEKKSKRDNSGFYWQVDLKDSAGKNMPRHLCFDAKIEKVTPGAKIKIISAHKNDTYYLNFPREGYAGRPGGAGGGYNAQRGDTIKLGALLQTHTMPMSYAKDIVVAEIMHLGLGKMPDPSLSDKAVNDRLMALYQIMHDTIVSDPAVQAALAVVPGEKRKEAEEKDISELRKNFAKEVYTFIQSLGTLCWVLPANIRETMLMRMSQTRGEDGKLTGGHPSVTEMSDEEVVLAERRFKQFQCTECPGDPRGCRYYKASVPGSSPEVKHFCSWTTRCLYVENSRA